ncbi:co-chaperone GroES [Wohlfahrtiimonas chitiniclastica]|uniref:co-chaperone GroES n=1 Tax=Wohlfahrtiimonas chitiniclastica TaxID=400946 RepID=UPI0021571169|nr:co-chaperone GroES [Wohlfahrtiimonas chitiniclastica]MDC7252037.1 10 kDa chaperonin [Wohlfahrtiimonas chitiniclastica]
MKLRPLHDRVIIELASEETTSAGGIVLPGSATEKPSRGKVIAVGTGKTLDNGQVKAVDVKVGDEILFGKYSGQDIPGYDGKKILREDEIMAVIEA